jgi:hypothetical protein
MANKGKKFMELYEDPEYRLNHLAYNNEKIRCNECGIVDTSRCNMKKHQRTKKCKKVCARRVDRVKALLLDEDDTDEIKQEKIINYIRNVQP